MAATSDSWSSSITRRLDRSRAFACAVRCRLSRLALTSTLPPSARQDHDGEKTPKPTPVEHCMKVSRPHLYEHQPKPTTPARHRPLAFQRLRQKMGWGGGRAKDLWTYTDVQLPAASVGPAAEARSHVWQLLQRAPFHAAFQAAERAAVQPSS